MLVDVEFRRPDPTMSVVLGLIGAGDVIPVRIDEGMYICGHWSIDQLGVAIRKRWAEEPPAEQLDLDGFGEYGVCDTPRQAVERLRLKVRPEKFFVTFVCIRRAEQPAWGGWRWHKWGPYIGDQKPRAEHLHDEPEIDEVYTYHVYEALKP